MLINTHKITKQRLLVKKAGSLVYSFYILDSNNNKIEDGLNVYGFTYYKTVICLNENIQ